MEPIETTLNLDQPKENELEYETLFGSSDSQAGNVFYPQIIQNQGAKALTRMGCSRYGICHLVNAQNWAVKKKDGMRFLEISGEAMWEIYLRKNPKAESEGATLQSALDQFIENGYITGYSRLTTIANMKASLDNCRLIYTGSQNGDWNSVRDNKIYRLRTDGRIVGHIFAIVGYDASGWIAINSYGENNGRFTIPFDLTDTLFSKYSISDFRDEEVFKNAL